MPELPDVEVFKRYMDATSLHQKITEASVQSRDILEGLSTDRLKKSLIRNRFESTRRHGKYLFAELRSGKWLVLHFGMTGFLKYFKDPEKEPPHDRLLITFDNGYHLAYDCQRKLGEIDLIENPDRFIEEKGLGDDPLDENFDYEAFQEALSRGRGAVKVSLMNQNMIAGVGNVYSDEILFQAGIQPETPIQKLNEGDLKRLFKTTRRVLGTAIERHADPDEFPRNWITPRRHGKETCPKCGRDLKHGKVSGRTSYYCPGCQKKK